MSDDCFAVCVLRIWKAIRLENTPRQVKPFHLSGYGVGLEFDISE